MLLSVELLLQLGKRDFNHGKGSRHKGPRPPVRLVGEI